MRRRLRVGERQGLAALVVLSRAGQPTTEAASNLLEVLDWDRLGASMAGSMEWEIYLHAEAVTGYVLCDGQGKCLLTLANWHLIQRMFTFSDLKDAMLSLGRGLWPLDSFLMSRLTEDLSELEQLS